MSVTKKKTSKKFLNFDSIIFLSYFFFNFIISSEYFQKYKLIYNSTLQ